MALRRLSPVIRSRLGGHDAYYVYCHSDRRQTKTGIRVEDISWTACSLRGRAMCCDGDNCEFLRISPKPEDLERYWTDPLMWGDRHIFTRTMIGFSLGGNSIYHGSSARSAGVL